MRDVGVKRWRQWMTPALVGSALGVLGGLDGVALASPTPDVGPIASWVHPVAAPDKTTAIPADAPLAMLLTDQQARQDEHGTALYQDIIFKVQTPQGLQPGGSYQLVWQPDTDTLTLHHYVIHRGDQTIDLLARNQPFTVLRRETNLEAAAIDGTLTVSLQAVGLQVGDVVDVAYTTVRNDPILRGQMGLLLATPWNVPVGRLHLRAQWPETLPVRWMTNGDLKGATRKADSGMREVDVDQRDLPALLAPDSAPIRYLNMRQLEVSSYTGMSDVVALIQPLFDKAAVLKPDSPLQAEITRIRTSSTDTKAQVAQALALVEDKVRYFYVGLADASLVPADADTTWDRRYGDCKGKTALLIALLTGLGVQAEPVLVNTQAGDGLDAFLPMPSLFNHVLVRAHIDGQTYWLDGTRQGDTGRPLDEFKVPPYFHWGLPLRAGEGAGLVAMVPPPLEQPNSDLMVSIDASAGISRPAPTTAKMIFRGDAAVALKNALDTLPPAAREQALRKFWRGQRSDLTPEQVSDTYDAATSTHTMSVKGSVTLDWGNKTDSGTARRRLWIHPSVVGWEEKPTRPAGSGQDAPYANAYPFYNRTSLTIKLPPNSPGFTLEGDDVDQDVAEYALHRHSAIADDMVSVETSSRALKPERPAKDEETVAKTLTALADVTVALIAPRNYQWAKEEEEDNQLSQPATTSDAMVRQARILSNKTHRDFKAAHALFEKALALEPNNASIYAQRGWMYLLEEVNIPSAESDFRKSLSMDKNNETAELGLLKVMRRMGKKEEAIANGKNYLLRNKESKDIIKEVSGLAFDIGDDESALEYLNLAIDIDDKDVDSHNYKALVLKYMFKKDESISEMRHTISNLQTSTSQKYYIAQLLNDYGITEDSIKILNELIADNPTERLYATREGFRDVGDFEGRQSDVDSLKKINKESPKIPLIQSDIYLDEGKIEDAEGVLVKYIEENTGNSISQKAALLFIYMKENKSQNADKVLDDLMKETKSPMQSNNICYILARHNAYLEKAEEKCRFALTEDPENSSFHDSMGYVRLRQGDYDQAISEFETALKYSHNRIDASWFGMGIAKIRSGRTQEGWDDINKARTLSARIEKRFAKDGIVP